ncbi:MAG: isoprenyl transferase [Caulobacterales bacterium]
MAGRPSTAHVPQHIAIIMDGNGRWAKSKNMPRVFGHRQGVEALRHTVEAAGELGVKYLTVFGFSTENWSRPADEVEALLELLRLYVNRDLDRLAREGVRVRVIGERSSLTSDIIRMIERAESSTLTNDKLNLTIAFNYGGQAEIVAVARKLAEEVEQGRLRASDVTQERFEAFLHTKDLPSPDVLIRTSGEMRISNFLLWQCAYTEFVFQDVLWPDFSKTHLQAAIDEYCARDRRYGGRDHDVTA